MYGGKECYSQVVICWGCHLMKRPCRNRAKCHFDKTKCVTLDSPFPFPHQFAESISLFFSLVMGFKKRSLLFSISFSHPLFFSYCTPSAIHGHQAIYSLFSFSFHHVYCLLDSSFKFSKPFFCFKIPHNSWVLLILL